MARQSYAGYRAMKLPTWLRRRLGPSRAALRSDIGDLSAHLASLEVRLADREARINALENLLRGG